jgi:ornithine cyclodeaminase
MSDFAVYRGADVVRWLDYPGCINAVRTAMSALSRGAAEKQPLRNITSINPNRLFALMPGIATDAPGFGAKLISVFHDPVKGGRSAHLGIVVLFEEDTGEVACVADAHELTKIRTACNSAVATEALARKEASTLTIYGCGTQAEAHVRAIPLVRDIQRIIVCGRDESTAETFAEEARALTDAEVVAMTDGRQAASEADIICTVTGASEPILLSDWVRPGTHVNAVGSSHPRPVEIDPHLVASSDYFVESRKSALAAAAEFIRGKEMGLFDDSHIRAEIGEVLNGDFPGRTSDSQRTVYKSLGHIVQDLAAARYLHQSASG